MKQTNKVVDAILKSKTMQNGDIVLIGLSGGPDSMCLAHALASIADTMKLTLMAVHVNHKLRGEKSDQEAAVARKFCEELGIPCKVIDFDCAKYAAGKRMSLEEAGRHARYEIFDRVAEVLHAKLGQDITIALAHNADDQAETVLFRLIRGTGLHGAAGMRSHRKSAKGYVIVRPLLKVSRADIEEYIAANNLKPNMDQSNAQTDFARNKIRLELIPYIEKNFNPNVKDALLRFAELARIDDDYLRQESTRRGGCSIRSLKQLDPALKTRVVARMIDDAGLHEGITAEHISAVCDLLASDNPSGQVDLPQGYVAAREYDNLIIGKRDEVLDAKSADLSQCSMKSRVMDIEEYRAMVQKIGPSGERKYYAAFDYDAFGEKYHVGIDRIVLRNRMEGDFIAIKGGTKKLQDYFVDAKVNKLERDSVLLVAIGNEILWVVNNKKFSHNFQINDTTQRVLFLEFEGEIW